MTITLAWHGDPALKAEALASMQAHRAADEIMQGNYLFGDKAAPAGYRGCFHGCLTADKLIAESGDKAEFVRDVDYGRRSPNWHAEGERIWGIPAHLGAALDRAFEGLCEPEHAEFAVAAIEAMPVGADLTRVADLTIFEMLADPERGAVLGTAGGTAGREAVQRVAGLYVRRLAGDEPSADEWLAARNTADELSDGSGSHHDDAVIAAYNGADVDGHPFGETYTWARYAAKSEDWAAWVASRLLHHMATAPVPVTT
jgi:hypothetical protein